jgi:hypothetical protein
VLYVLHPILQTLCLTAAPKLDLTNHETLLFVLGSPPMLRDE